MPPKMVYQIAFGAHEEKLHNFNANKFMEKQTV